MSESRGIMNIDKGTSTTASRRDILVETALDLFYRDGFHATGIDRVLAEAGVAKMTLYKHFRSKDELIVAALRLHDRRFREWFVVAVESRAKKPRKRLLAIFSVLAEWMNGDSFQGCAFAKAAAEYGDPANPIHRAGVEHKRYMLYFIVEQARAAGARNPRKLANGLMLLVEGAIATAQVTGDRDAADHARKAAKVLLADAIR